MLPAALQINRIWTDSTIERKFPLMQPRASHRLGDNKLGLGSCVPRNAEPEVQEPGPVSQKICDMNKDTDLCRWSCCVLRQ
jgi:hypothetical protein